MDKIRLERKERIKMFFNEYYFGVSKLTTIFRLIGGPLMFYIGLTMYSNAGDRFGVGYGGFMIAFSIYYTFLPFLWVLIRKKYYQTIEFQVEATPDKLIIKEDESESQTEYLKFEKILKRKHYFTLAIQKSMKIFLPIEKLSERNIQMLTERVKN